MCGIFGCVNNSNANNLQELQDHFITSLNHRGPDSFGVDVNANILIGMVRLAIVDIKNGEQPFFSEDKNIVAVVNGEIYNFQSVKTSLQERGHKFITQSDCEIVVHLYEEYGTSLVNHIEGMFAIAIYDKTRKKIVLIRDRFGKKPIYYIRTEDFAFSSEIKGLLKVNGVGKNINFRSLSNYLYFRYILGNETIYQNVLKVPQGSFLEYNIELKTINIQKYWIPTYHEVFNYKEDYVLNKINNLFENAVKKRMISDIPIGVLLSGGIDSSAIVAVMSKLANYKIPTFTLGYKEQYANKNADVIAAKKIAKIFSTEHTEYFISANDFINEFENILSSFDEPFSGAFSTYFICKAIKAQNIHVLMNGDGGDEQFASYLAHRLAIPVSNFNALKKANQQITSENAHVLSPYENDISYINSIAKKNQDWRTSLFFISQNELNSIFNDDINAELNGYNPASFYKANYINHLSSNDPLNKILQLEIETFLVDNLLYLTDRLSMAHSIEIRCPFLDNDLTSFLSTIPGSMKVKNGVTKYLQKRAFEKLLPDDIINRPKEGFIQPSNEWLMDYLKEFAYETLSDKRLSIHNFFNSVIVKKILDEHFEKKKFNSYKIWGLIIFQYWYEKNICLA